MATFWFLFLFTSSSFRLAYWLGQDFCRIRLLCPFSIRSSSTDSSGNSYTNKSSLDSCLEPKQAEHLHITRPTHLLPDDSDFREAFQQGCTYTLLSKPVSHCLQIISSCLCQKQRLQKYVISICQNEQIISQSRVSSSAVLFSSLGSRASPLIVHQTLRPRYTSICCGQESMQHIFTYLAIALRCVGVFGCSLTVYRCSCISNLVLPLN